MCVYVYTYVYAYVCVCVCVHAYLYACTCVVYTCMYNRKYVCSHVTRSHARFHTCLSMSVRVCVCMHICNMIRILFLHVRNVSVLLEIVTSCM